LDPAKVISKAKENGIGYDCTDETGIEPEIDNEN